jgi:hypothetical protein
VLAITAVGGIGFFLTVELTSAVEVAGYSNNIEAKRASKEYSLRGSRCYVAEKAGQTVIGGYKAAQQFAEDTGLNLTSASSFGTNRG